MFLFTFARMEQVYQLYQDIIHRGRINIAHLSHTIHLLGTIRLILFVGFFVTLYFLSDRGIAVWGLITFLFGIPFIALMAFHTFLFNKRKREEILCHLCENELKGLDYDFSAFHGNTDSIKGSHSFQIDLDLFGERSFFQSINRTSTYIGNEKLAQWLLSPLTDKEAILARQEAVKELGTKTIFRQMFYVEGLFKPGKQRMEIPWNKLMRTTTYFSDSKYWKALIFLFPAVWTVLFIGTFIGWIDLSILSIAIVLSMVIAYSKAKQTSALHNQVDKLDHLLGTYAELIRLIESTDFESQLLNEFKGRLEINGKASDEIRRLSRAIGALNQRMSAAGLLLQIFTLRDVRTSIRIERWMTQNSQHLPQWIDVLANFDALNSMGNFGFNHPDYIYPEIADRYFQMEGKSLGHPLMNRNTCVKNAISIKQSPWFIIITGANMAGKSTYLRTIGINHVLACTGMPVCAESLSVYPAQLVTSLRTSDDLMNNESYFFAELKRLKMIIDRLQSGEKLFIILDEILKGTNSIDKQKGSLALMKQLIRLEACGIIATHDLVLGTLEEEFPEQIRNYRFEADITNDELSFTYQLRPGVAQNMNACFLMQKMGITI